MNYTLISITKKVSCQIVPSQIPPEFHSLPSYLFYSLPSYLLHFYLSLLHAIHVGMMIMIEQSVSLCRSLSDVFSLSLALSLALFRRANCIDTLVISKWLHVSGPPCILLCSNPPRKEVRARPSPSLSLHLYLSIPLIYFSILGMVYGVGHGYGIPMTDDLHYSLS